MVLDVGGERAALLRGECVPVATCTVGAVAVVAIVVAGAVASGEGAAVVVGAVGADGVELGAGTGACSEESCHGSVLEGLHYYCGFWSGVL
jgi:hypothetical protein